MLTEHQEHLAIKELRTMSYKRTQDTPVQFIDGGYVYTVPPIPHWANELHTRGISVKYGAWGYKRERVQ